jgi:GDSL-like Lipase/Acylhydrolase family
MLFVVSHQTFKINLEYVMNHEPNTLNSYRITRREGLLTALASALTLAGCGGGGGGDFSAPSPAAPVTGPINVAGGVPDQPVTPADPAKPVLKVLNNQIVVFGDSRSANATQDSNSTSTNRITADSYIPYAMIASNFRGDFTGNYAINSDKLAQMRDRLGPVTGEARSNLLVDKAGIVIFLGGVNNSDDPIGVTGPLYLEILQKLADAGKTVILCNEIPSNTTGVAADEQINRRRYLDALVLPKNNDRVIKINSFDALLEDGTANSTKAGYNGSDPTDSLHPGPRGHRVLGELIGVELEKLLAADYPSRSAKLPSAAADSVLKNALLTGTTGTIVTTSPGGGGLNNFAGVLADGWQFESYQTFGSSLTVKLSKGKDADGYDTQVIAVSNLGATSPTPGGDLIMSNTAYVSETELVSGNSPTYGNGIGLTGGDKVFSVARVKVSDTAKGLLGPGLQVLVSSPSFPDSGQANLSGTIALASRDWSSSAAFDKTVLSQPRVLPDTSGVPTETKTIQQALVLSIAGGAPVDFTITISRFGIVKTI